jgi:hypothetical protein
MTSLALLLTTQLMHQGPISVLILVLYFLFVLFIGFTRLEFLRQKRQEKANRSQSGSLLGRSSPSQASTQFAFGPVKP